MWSELIPNQQWRCGDESSTSHHSLTGAHKASTSSAISGLLSKPDCPGFGALEGCQSTRTVGRRHSLALKQAGHHAKNSTCCSPPLPSPRNASKAPGEMLSLRVSECRRGLCSTHETTAGPTSLGTGGRARAPPPSTHCGPSGIP